MSSTKKHLSLFAVVGSVVIAAFASSSPPPIFAVGGSIVGTWRIAVNPPEGEDFFSLMVFDKGNTMTERVSLSRGLSMGSGLWERIAGHNQFAATFEAFSDDDLDGVFDTRERLRLTIQIDDDTLSGTATLDIFSLDGTILFFSIPGVILEGTRMTVIPE